MSSDEARQYAEESFKRKLEDGSAKVPDYERHAAEVRQKIKYLRELRLAKQREILSQNPR